jgi:DNA helicase IV
MWRGLVAPGQRYRRSVVAPVRAITRLKCPPNAERALDPQMSDHPDHEAEQAYIDFSYACLETSREKATELHDMVESGAGGTHQARFERDVISESVNNRVSQLDVGDSSLVFGRIDQNEDSGGESYHIGRIGVWGPANDPVLVDWRAPVAEPFFRATGRQSMGLVRRRHFATRGRQLLGVEDEFFGEGPGSLTAVGGEDSTIKGRQTLGLALEASRTGRLGDIVATIQGEQDEVIRAPMPGALVVQGGPGTGKTVVALHRAAYLLYTYRFPLEGQGVLVLGPNRVFLTYIEQVLPSLGESGVEMAVLGDLVSDVRIRGFDKEDVARVKGDLRMNKVVAKAVRDRQRPLREDLIVGYGLQRLRLSVEQSREIIAAARRRARNHNRGRKFVVEAFYEALSASSRSGDDPATIQDRVGESLEVREALEWMWPVLTPAHLIHDLYGSRGLIAAAAGKYLSAEELELLHRPRSVHATEVLWSADDAPLLDEAAAKLGPRPSRKTDESARTYGHIVIDEAQDLSPMQLRMVARRSLNGSITLVGDIAQATSAWAHDDWGSVLEHLPTKREPRFAELTIGYRLPGPTMNLAARVLAVAAPSLEPPVSVRTEGDEPRLVPLGGRTVADAIVDEVRTELAAVGSGNVSVIAVDDHVEALSKALAEAGIANGLVYQGALEMQVSVVPARMVKGLEVDSAVVVDPIRIAAEGRQGMRLLYVALTRATRRLTVLHDGLPDVLVNR